MSDVKVPHSLAQKWTLFPREQLYFCTDCQLLQSPDMTIDIVECVYCPMCLVEIPKSSAQRVCTRNCLQCPQCLSALDVLKTTKDASNYTLKCTYCEYSTEEYVSDKPLATQILQQQSVQSNPALASATRQYIRRLFVPKDQDSAKAMAALSVGEVPSSTPTKKMDKVIVDVKKGSAEGGDTVKLPILPLLKGKRSKLCYRCEAPLIVPSKKPASVTLKASELAIHYIPDIKVISFTNETVMLRAHNALQEELKLSISTVDVENESPLKPLFPAGATVITPSLVLNSSVDLLSVDDATFACSFPVETINESVFKTKLVMNNAHKGVKRSWDDIEIELEGRDAKKLAVYVHCKSKTVDVGYWLVLSRPEKSTEKGEEEGMNQPEDSQAPAG